jgi:hypothetical protein
VQYNYRIRRLRLSRLLLGQEARHPSPRIIRTLGEMDSHVFKFRGMPVGYFEGPAYPSQSGEYHYIPYRGPGHYKMGAAIKEEGAVTIEFDVLGVGWTARAQIGSLHVISLTELACRSPVSK